MRPPAVGAGRYQPHQCSVFLTPMFLWAADGDLPAARQAALETLNAYRARSAISLITAATLIAFELAILALLSQSLDDDLSPALALRFRSNANSLDRSAERNHQLLEQQRIPTAEHLTEERAAAAVAEAQQRVQQVAASLQASRAAEPAPAHPAAQPAAASPPPAPMNEAERRTAWAQAMATVAAECRADLDRLPPAERAKEMMRINTLTESASALVAGIAPIGHPGTPPAVGFTAPAGTPGA
ncbi:MAG: hypothetical protein ACJ8AW_39390 [Rhodopila sp.]